MSLEAIAIRLEATVSRLEVLIHSQSTAISTQYCQVQATSQPLPGRLDCSSHRGSNG